MSFISRKKLRNLGIAATVFSLVAFALYFVNYGINNEYLFGFFILFGVATIVMHSNIKEEGVCPNCNGITKEKSEGEGIFYESYLYCEKCDKKYSLDKRWDGLP